MSDGASAADPSGQQPDGQRSDGQQGDGRAPHVLYVAWGFPPHRGPGTYRALATVNALVGLGARVTVITADLATFEVVSGADPSLLAHVDPAVRVVRVPFPPGRRDPVVSRWSRQRAEAPGDWRDATTARELAVYPELTYALWRPRLDAAAYRLHRADPVDLVIATGNPYVDFSPAFSLGVESGVPYVLDDRDSWLLDVYTGEQLDPGGPAERLWEVMQRRCTEAWFVNPPIADWYRRRFPDQAERVHVVENGWDGAYLADALTPRRPDPQAPVFGYLGTISGGLPVELLLDAWRRARPRLGENAELRFYGQIGHGGSSGEADRVRLFADHARHGVRHLGRWPKSEVGRAYAELDVLVFAKEGGGLVTSGKVYEYAATGRPVVTVIDPDHDARRVLAAYPRRHDPRRLDPAAVADAFVAAWEDARGADPERVAAGQAAGAALRRDALLVPALRRVLDAALAARTDRGPASAGSSTTSTTTEGPSDEQRVEVGG